MKIQKHGASYRLWLVGPDGRGRYLSAGRVDRATAEGIAAMTGTLVARREWAILSEVIEGRNTLVGLWEAWTKDPELAAIREALDDCDLDPFVTAFGDYLSRRGTRSADRYVYQVRQLIPAGARFPRSRFTRAVLSRHLDALPGSGSMKVRHRAGLQQFARFLVEREVMTHNVVRDVRGARNNPPRDTHLETHEMLAQLKALPLKFRALEGLMLTTGAEWESCERLLRRHIDLDAGRVFLGADKNDHRARTVPIIFELVAERDRKGRELPNLVRAALEAHVRGLTELEPVFDVSNKWANEVHHKAREAARVRHHFMHDHRHTFCVQMIRRFNAPDAVLAHHLGHRDTTMVRKIYGKYRVDDRDYAFLGRGAAPATPQLRAVR